MIVEDNSKKTVLVYKKGNSNKFYRIILAANALSPEVCQFGFISNWGRINKSNPEEFSGGQRKQRFFTTRLERDREVDLLVQSKLKKGYEYHTKPKAIITRVGQSKKTTGQSKKTTKAKQTNIDKRLARMKGAK